MVLMKEFGKAMASANALGKETTYPRDLVVRAEGEFDSRNHLVMAHVRLLQQMAAAGTVAHHIAGMFNP